MRSSLVLLSITVPCAIARADEAPPPAEPSSDDAELMKYAAEAEAKARQGNPETIIVEDSAGPIDTPSAGVRVVSARALELTPHKNTDDYLKLVPGLYMSQHGSEGKGQQFFLRGFDAVHGSDVSIRVNGIPINEMSNVHGQGYADLGFVIPETVNGLTSRKGPFDLEQGWFATAGSIDLVLGTANRGRKVGYELGSTNRHRVVVMEAPKGRPDAEFVAADVMHDDGYGKFRGTEHASLMGQTELRAGRLTVRPLVAGNWTRFGEPGVVALDDIESDYFDRMDAPAGNLGGRSQRLLGGVGATYARGANEVVGSAHVGWRGLDLDENFTGFLENEQYGDARRQSHRAISGGARVAWRHRLSRSVRLLTGTEVLRDQISQHEDRVSTAGMVWRNERSTEAATTSAGAWAGAQLRSGRWLATAGTRVDAMAVDARDRLDPMRDGSGVVAAVSPRAAVAWRGRHLGLSVAAGRGVRPPEARAFTVRASRENEMTTTYDGGDPEITTAQALEAGAEVRNERVTAGATGFATWIDREAVFDHLSGLTALLDGSRRVGAELYVEAKPASWLAVRGDVTFVDARFVVTQNPVPGAPRVLASAEARIDMKPWSAGLTGRFLGPRPLIHGATAASSTVFDAIGNYQRGRWALSFQIDNLLGTDWNEGEYHFASRWDLSAPESNLPRVHISPGRPFGFRAGASVTF